MTNREKLIQLVDAAVDAAEEACVQSTCANCTAFPTPNGLCRAALVADHLLASGHVIVLPCKVGDTVYIVSNNTDACRGCEYYSAYYAGADSFCEKVEDIDDRYYPEVAEKPICEKQFMEAVAYRPKENWIFNHSAEFGKTVFLTREAAEAALKEARSDG